MGFCSGDWSVQKGPFLIGARSDLGWLQPQLLTALLEQSHALQQVGDGGQSLIKKCRCLLMKLHVQSGGSQESVAKVGVWQLRTRCPQACTGGVHRTRIGEVEARSQLLQLILERHERFVAALYQADEQVLALQIDLLR